MIQSLNQEGSQSMNTSDTQTIAENITPSTHSIPTKQQQQLITSQRDQKIANSIQLILDSRLANISKNQATQQSSIDSFNATLANLTRDAEKIYNFMVKVDDIKPTPALPAQTASSIPATQKIPAVGATSSITSTTVSAQQLLQQVQQLQSQKTLPTSQSQVSVPKLTFGLEIIKESLPTVVSASLYSPRVDLIHPKQSEPNQQHTTDTDIHPVKHHSSNTLTHDPIKEQAKVIAQLPAVVSQTITSSVTPPPATITIPTISNPIQGQEQRIQQQRVQQATSQPLTKVKTLNSDSQEIVQDIQVDVSGKGKVIPKIMDLKTLRNMARNKSSDNPASMVDLTKRSNNTSVDQGYIVNGREVTNNTAGSNKQNQQQLIEENWAACDNDDENLLDYNSKGKEDDHSEYANIQLPSAPSAANKQKDASGFSEEKLKELLEKYVIDLASSKDIQQFCHQYPNKKDALSNSLVFFSIELENQIDTFKQKNPQIINIDSMSLKATTKEGIQLLSLDFMNELLQKDSFEENILAMFDVLFILLLNPVELAKYSSASSKEDFIRDFVSTNHEAFAEIIFKMEDTSIALNGNYQLKKQIKALIEKYPVLLDQTAYFDIDPVCAMISPVIDEVCTYFGIKETKLNKANVSFFESQFHQHLASKVKELNPIISDLD